MSSLSAVSQRFTPAQKAWTRLHARWLVGITRLWNKGPEWQRGQRPGLARSHNKEVHPIHNEGKKVQELSLMVWSLSEYPWKRCSWKHELKRNVLFRIGVSGSSLVHRASQHHCRLRLPACCQFCYFTKTTTRQDNGALRENMHTSCSKASFRPLITGQELVDPWPSDNAKQREQMWGGGGAMLTS